MHRHPLVPVACLLVGCAATPVAVIPAPATRADLGVAAATSDGFVVCVGDDVLRVHPDRDEVLRGRLAAATHSFLVGGVSADGRIIAAA